MVKKIIPIFFFLLILPLISAVPPFAEEGAESFSEGFFVEYTPIGTYENGKDIQINTHVFNISNGVEVDNSTVSCKFSLFNQTGNHVINNIDMIFTLNGNDWEYLILGGNFTINGVYSYLVDCQDSTNNLGGFVVVEFEITNTGFSLTTSRSIIYSVFFIVLIFLFVITIFGINILPSSNTKDEEGKIISINHLKYLRPMGWIFEWMLLIAIFFLSSNLAFAYLGEELFANILFILFKICFGLTPVIIILSFIWILAKIFQDKKIKKLLDRGIFPQGNF